MLVMDTRNNRLVYVLQLSLGSEPEDAPRTRVQLRRGRVPSIEPRVRPRGCPHEASGSAFHAALQLSLGSEPEDAARDRVGDGTGGAPSIEPRVRARGCGPLAKCRRAR